MSAGLTAEFLSLLLRAALVQFSLCQSLEEGESVYMHVSGEEQQR